MLNSGASWRDLPERYGPWQTVYDRFCHWQKQGVVERILQALRLKFDEQGLIEPSTWHIDATMIKAHKAAAGAGKESGPQALGRSRSSYSSKLHLVCKGQGVPVQMLLTGGERNEITQAKVLLEQCHLQLRRGRPRLRPQVLIADKGYDSQPLRQWLGKRGVKANIAERELREGTKRRRRGRKPTFDAQLYRQRNVIERSFGRIKECRRVATRYDKLDKVYLCFVYWAFITTILKKYFSDTP